MSQVQGTSPVDRLVSGILICLMAIGSLALWVLVPPAALWLVARMTASPSAHLVIALVAVPLAMVLFAAVLILLNTSYLRVNGAGALVEDEDGFPVRVRGPLESMLVLSFVAAAVWGIIWLFAHPVPQFSVG